MRYRLIALLLMIILAACTATPERTRIPAVETQQPDSTATPPQSPKATKPPARRAKATATIARVIRRASSTPLPSETAMPSLTPFVVQDFSVEKLGKVERNVTYCSPGGKAQVMDLYYPETPGPWPVVIYIHGGSWSGGDKSEVTRWSPLLLEQDFLVVSVNYRLYPDAKFPAMIKDVKCAVRYLRAYARQYNIDPGRIAAMGHSAGGHLAALLGASDTDAGWDKGEFSDQSSRVQAVIDIAGPADLTRPFPNLSDSIRQVFGDPSGSDDPRLVQASPVHYVTPDDPPFLILQGDFDEYVPFEQAEILKAQLKSAGVLSKLVMVQNADHLLHDVGLGMSPSKEEIDQTIAAFLNKYLK